MNDRITRIDDLDALLGLVPSDSSAGPDAARSAVIIHCLVGPGDTRDYDRDAPLPHTLHIGKSVLADIIEDNLDHLAELLEEDDAPGPHRDARIALFERRRELLAWVLEHPEVNVRVTLSLPGSHGRRER